MTKRDKIKTLTAMKSKIKEGKADCLCSAYAQVMNDSPTPETLRQLGIRLINHAVSAHYSKPPVVVKPTPKQLNQLRIDLALRNIETSPYLKEVEPRLRNAKASTYEHALQIIEEGSRKEAIQTLRRLIKLYNN